MKKALLILGGLIVLGAGMEIILNRDKPALPAEMVSFDQVYQKIDSYNVKLNEIKNNCEKDVRCAVVNNQKSVRFEGVKNDEDILKTLDKWLTEDNKIYAK